MHKKLLSLRQGNLWRILFTVCLLAGLLASSQRSQAATAPAMQMDIAADPPRRANIPYFSGSVDWAKSAILWFGVNERGLPGKNYVDVRLAYTPSALLVRFTVIDYYLWYKTNATTADDLTQYDAVALYLDTNHDRSATPNTDDYLLLSGSRHFPTENAPAYHRDARGTGSGWDNQWDGSWQDTSAMQWSTTGGPNNNGGNIDYGWYSYFTIPWSVVGKSGPPANGTVWGLGLRLYDRDAAPPASPLAQQTWPPSADYAKPSTWGDLHFGPATYTPKTTTQTGSITIRAASPTDNTVEDAWMGGGGTCAGGHEGGSEINHGNEASLYTGSESSPTHFPCFNKSFLRFKLSAIPAGVEIISARLTLHQFGNASNEINPGPAWVHLFNVRTSWSEATIHWNNAPIPQENVSLTQVNKLNSFPGWPGVARTWDASKPVAEAYARSESVNLAIYSSDVGRDTSIYFVGSETEDWNAEARPALYVTWGQATPQLNKTGSPWLTTRNTSVTYTLTWTGSGEPLTLVDQLPQGFGTPGSIQVNVGSASYDASSRQVRWSGTPAQGQAVTLTYRATVNTDGPRRLLNTATLSENGTAISSDTFSVFVDPLLAYLPLVRR
ncbi:MAG: DNRLRE domain-containing protein [Chloroflexota bacterium]